MRPYSHNEKHFIRIIVEKTPSTESFFQRLLSEKYFLKDYRPFIWVDGENKKFVLFFRSGERHEAFFRFMNLVALMEDLKEDRLVVQFHLEKSQNENYFLGEFFDAYEEKGENGDVLRYVSKSTGRSIALNSLNKLCDQAGNIIEDLDPVYFDDPSLFERVTKAFSGVVYPREALIEIVKNNFLSVEQRRHRQTTKLIICGIIISVTGLILSFYLVFFHGT